MEGVERNKVRLLPHNKEWETEFLQAKEQLEKLWSANIIDIQHIGSTSIKAICAKPILDVAIKLKSINDMNIEILVKHGYDYCGAQHGNKNYHLFVLCGMKQISLKHIHCYDKEEKEFDLLVGFRDYLNMNTDEALKYERIKKKLAEKYPDDRIAYTNGKEEFIKSIYERISI